MIRTVYLCEDYVGKFLTWDDRFPGPLEVHEYEDPVELEDTEWVDGVLADLGVGREGVSRATALMWLVDNHPEAVRKPFREIRKRFYEPILKCEAALIKSAADKMDQGGM